MTTEPRRAAIIGAGPAGLTAAWELLERTAIEPVVFEVTDNVGGISQTAVYKGNRIDFGGHRFFSKSDRVMQWWLRMLPLERRPENEEDLTVAYQNQTRELVGDSLGPDPDETDEVMLVRSRLSRIYYGRKFYDYPIALNRRTLTNLGPWSTLRIGLSYIKARLFPVRPEANLEDFFINRFGRALYAMFFRDYTRKVWGVPCTEISSEWGAQRIKGVSLVSVLTHALFGRFRSPGGLEQKRTETSLIERFLYPKYGPGQMWEVTADRIRARGGKIQFNQKVVDIEIENDRVVAIQTQDAVTGQISKEPCDLVISSMPVPELIAALGDAAPPDVRDVARGLLFRDFITVGVLASHLTIQAGAREAGRNGLVPDNWIYIQEPDVHIGRLQVFNNWSPYMVADPDTVWLGCEYFCTAGDDLWNMADHAFADMAVRELEQIGVLEKNAVLDTVVLRMPKAYPAYFGSYDRFGEIRKYTDTIKNLFLVGRNGTHRYNNQDHSMLGAMVVVDNLVDDRDSKDNVWAVNTEEEYHEERSG